MFIPLPFIHSVGACVQICIHAFDLVAEKVDLELESGQASDSSSDSSSSSSSSSDESDSGILRYGTVPVDSLTRLVLLRNVKLIVSLDESGQVSDCASESWQAVLRVADCICI
jgi:hypothetical protein